MLNALGNEPVSCNLLNIRDKNTEKQMYLTLTKLNQCIIASK